MNSSKTDRRPLESQAVRGLREVGWLVKSARDAAVAAAVEFTAVLAELDRGARREQRTLPTREERQLLSDAFWGGMMSVLGRVDRQLSAPDLVAVQRDVQAVLNPWLLRSRLWARSWVKPHGFPGDYRMLEWIYDLQRDECARANQPAAINLLDGLFRSVHGVQAVWDRRVWFAQLIASHVHPARPVRVLDIASGGSRYVRDVIDSYGPNAVAPTFFDQDPAALSFVRSWLPADVAATTVCAPVSRIGEILSAPYGADLRPFDVVISTGLFDYLPTDSARRLIAHMTALTRPAGTVAICNFSPEDKSRVVKDWVADWPLIYRTDRDLAALFPRGCTPTLSRSPDGGLLYARVDAGHRPAWPQGTPQERPGGGEA